MRTVDSGESNKEGGWKVEGRGGGGIRNREVGGETKKRRGRGNKEEKREGNKEEKRRKWAQLTFSYFSFFLFLFPGRVRPVWEKGNK